MSERFLPRQEQVPSRYSVNLQGTDFNCDTYKSLTPAEFSGMIDRFMLANPNVSMLLEEEYISNSKRLKGKKLFILGFIPENDLVFMRYKDAVRGEEVLQAIPTIISCTQSALENATKDKPKGKLSILISNDRLSDEYWKFYEINSKKSEVYRGLYNYLTSMDPADYFALVAKGYVVQDINNKLPGDEFTQDLQLPTEEQMRPVNNALDIESKRISRRKFLGAAAAIAIGAVGTKGIPYIYEELQHQEIQKKPLQIFPTQVPTEGTHIKDEITLDMAKEQLERIVNTLIQTPGTQIATWEGSHTNLFGMFITPEQERIFLRVGMDVPYTMSYINDQWLQIKEHPHETGMVYYDTASGKNLFISSHSSANPDISDAIYRWGENMSIVKFSGDIRTKNFQNMTNTDTQHLIHNLSNLTLDNTSTQVLAKKLATDESAGIPPTVIIGTLKQKEQFYPALDWKNYSQDFSKPTGI